ncbi:MAG: AraC family transcriptional regulator [SAR86 cluster bacterium]|uniref:AraC family transcriptional regulator n=1 Tax=SAR86 cluster bacterium TaxID=2030880 RepID=A0A2A4XGD6_9GAMM|nr:MAG: AraC family transcriptional regulator [SAR86 cluster bacterium]
MDKLSEVLNHFSISAGVFYSGNLCGLSSFSGDGEEEGHLHLLGSGKLEVIDHNGKKIEISEPSVLFFPRPAHHRLMAEEGDKAQVVCASINYGTGCKNPLANALPALVVIKLADAPVLQFATEMLFKEAANEESGKSAMMDRLTEVFIIQLFRYVMNNDIVQQGMLSGLAHPQLSKAIMAIHEEPEKNWSLEELAERCAMSRSKFAELFKELMGQPPGDYILEWRVAMAQGHLKRGKPVGWIANAVGYENASALARVFRKKTGQSPKQWLSLQRGSDH